MKTERSSIQQDGLVVLSGGESSIVIDTLTPSPTVLHWGAPVGHMIGNLRDAVHKPVLHGGLDTIAPLSLIPEHGSGYLERPGLEGYRAGGVDWAPRFVMSSTEVADDSVVCVSVDSYAHLEQTVEFVLRPSGALRVRATLRNAGESDYHLDALRVTLPIPARAAEVMTFGGRWSNEFQVRREALATGTLSVENRSGRTSHDRVPTMFCGVRGFEENSGEVWGVHLEWSGNASVASHSATDGRRSIQINELLFPGEIVLAPGSSYATPWVCCAYSSRGANGVSQQFHQELRNDPSHPVSVRPVTLNIWEAVYFNHHLPTLIQLADRAAAIGVERFVVDDGWFHGRRNDSAGLGDWWVDAEVWPDGLSPLADHVVGLGMQFGLWFEPEMVNPDSDLFRTHPDWVLSDHRYPPVTGRQQLVLDLSNDDVFTYLFEKVSTILKQYPISYVKWDMNRPLIHASHHGRACVHEQTLALYRLLDRLHEAHPAVEIETCASGGGRIDFGILRRTSRAWTSDCNDPLDRQRIQRGFSYVFPPEYMGAHIAAPHSHNSRRTHSLAFRAGSAFFGHFGIEWNILEATDAQAKDLAFAIETHKRFRPLLHGGTVVRLDHPNPSVTSHLVVSEDQRSALLSFAMVGTAASLMVEPLLIHGLDDDTMYRVEVLPFIGSSNGGFREQTRWFEGGVTVSGQVVRAIGIQPPTIDPESLVLLQLNAV